MEIGMWVTTELGLPEHESKFVDNHIDGSVLNMMKKEDLKKLGITSVGHRIKILDGLAAIRQAEQVNERNKILLSFTEHHYCPEIYPRKYTLSNTGIEMYVTPLVTRSTPHRVHHRPHITCSLSLH